MAEIITYKPGAFCQIRFPNGERALISCAQTGIKVVKLLFGILPTKTIANWPISEISSAIKIFADPNNPTQHPLDAIKNKLLDCSSISEVQKVCDGKDS